MLSIKKKAIQAITYTNTLQLRRIEYKNGEMLNQ